MVKFSHGRGRLDRDTGETTVLPILIVLVSLIGAGRLILNDGAA